MLQAVPQSRSALASAYRFALHPGQRVTISPCPTCRASQYSEGVIIDCITEDMLNGHKVAVINRTTGKVWIGRVQPYSLSLFRCTIRRQGYLLPFNSYYFALLTTGPIQITAPTP